MKVGWVGAGKLGLPCALVLDEAGHDVIVTDTNPVVESYLDSREVPYQEVDVPRLLARHTVGWRDTAADVVAVADVVFVAVQTPHSPEFDGTHLLTDERRDFEYAYLVQAVRDVCAAAARRSSAVTVVIVSTVLPGTFNRHLRSLANEKVRLVYNPFFIAMGTTVLDFRSPEMILAGSDRPGDLAPVLDLYRTIHDAPVAHVSIETAELTKVAYNTFIGLKVAFGNLMGELCHKTGADVDDLVDALSLATDRIVSPRYMRAGMGDGGGCHPRDNLALSQVARSLDLHHDLFSTLMEAREQHSVWLAGLVRHWAALTGLPTVLLGKAYKPGTNLTVGSPAALLAKLYPFDRWHDHHVDGQSEQAAGPSVFFIGTRHPEYPEAEFPKGSVVIDPFGYIPDQAGVTVIRIGRK